MANIQQSQNGQRTPNGSYQPSITSQKEIISGIESEFTEAQPAEPQEEPPRGAAILKAAKIDYSEPLPPPPIAISVGKEVFGTLGNFSLIYGKAKSKKTFAVSLAVAAALGTDTGQFQGILPYDKRRVVFADTEQGAYDVNKVARRVMEITGHNEPLDNFDVYKLREFGYKDRLEAIEYLIENTPDLGLLVIDGIRDLVSSINDEHEATSMADRLLQWTDQKQIHIITVLHQNKGDINARGHLGTELINKTETALSVRVEPDNKEVSICEIEFGRHKPFEPFAFRIGQHGIPEVIEGWAPKKEDKAGMYKISPDEISTEQHDQILALLKAWTDKPKYSELKTQTSLAIKQVTGHQCGETKAKEYLTFYQNGGSVTRKGKERSPQAFYEIDAQPVGYDGVGGLEGSNPPKTTQTQISHPPQNKP